MKICTKQEQEKDDGLILAAYAASSGKSEGRIFEEGQHPYRTDFQRDKDRIIHSNAFRRLEYKTQVLANYTGDLYRTRLTHSLEVAGVARTIARALKLNEDLCETVGLAHDIGHPPFGHSGEDQLKELMKTYNNGQENGFEHNGHAIRILTKLEKRSPNYDGLNLTFETRESMIKHSPMAVVPTEYNNNTSPLLESYVVDISDEIAYDNADVEDGLRANLIVPGNLEKLALWKYGEKRVNEKFSNLDAKTKRYQIIHSIIGLEIDDVINNSIKNINNYKLDSLKSVRNCQLNPIKMSDEIAEMRLEMKQFLFKEFYFHKTVKKQKIKGTHYIKEIFKFYMENPDTLPDDYKKILVEDGTARAVCDYIACMTDRFAEKEYFSLFTPSSNYI